MKKLCILLFCSAVMFGACNSENKNLVLMEKWKGDSGTLNVDTTYTLRLDSGQTAVYNGPRKGKFADFELTGFVYMEPGAAATLRFHSDNKESKGYEIAFRNGPMDGTLKTGSLKGVRNLYKSMAADRTWTSFVLAVIDKHISLYVNGIEVVSYTEPENPYRADEFKNMVLGSGNFTLSCVSGSSQFRDFLVNTLPRDHKAKREALPAIDEQNDRIIRLQQAMFPVIDYHVHLKGMTKEEALAKSLNYGIEYGLAPNCGIGFPITTDQQVKEYLEENIHMPFFFGMQGEGREWVTTFSADSRSLFDYVFTDALTFTDHKGRRTRLWIDEEVFIDIPQEQYMDIIVDRTLKVLGEEPIDIYVNPTFLPSTMEKDYDKLWTDERIAKVVKALKDKNIALEINARYRIPSFKIIKAAKDAGIKLTFGTNNGDGDMGKLEYCVEAIDACGITADDMWFPADKTVR